MTATVANLQGFKLHASSLALDSEALPPAPFGQSCSCGSTERAHLGPTLQVTPKVPSLQVNPNLSSPQEDHSICPSFKWIIQFHSNVPYPTACCFGSPEGTLQHPSAHARPPERQLTGAQDALQLVLPFVSYMCSAGRLLASCQLESASESDPTQ